jgi:NAD(P)H-hydrate repair Nnr-like enzyme with NAD(P)H-hydrate dehydratase domain
MGLQSTEVQAHRMDVAQAIANRFGCTVVLKGSGTVITAPDKLPRINTSGSARLATAGTGDVLAGLIGAHLAADGDLFERTCEAVFWHGHVSDNWNAQATMTAQDLVFAL